MGKDFINRKVRRKQLADRYGIILLKKVYATDPGLNSS